MVLLLRLLLQHRGQREQTIVSMITIAALNFGYMYMTTEQPLSTVNGPQSLTNLSLSNQKALTVVRYPRSLFKGSTVLATRVVEY